MIDLIIIGAGPGGYELALAASLKNLSVLLIEKDKLGGTCLNHGCIPTKSYYKNAEVLNTINNSEVYGISYDNFNFNFKIAKERKDNVVSLLVNGIEGSLNKAGVHVVYGEGKIIDKTTVKVNDETYNGKYIVIATGSSPIRIPNFENAITSKDLLSLEVLPKKLVIIGGGVIGIEFASILSLMGVEIEVVEMMDRIIPNIDKEIAKRLHSYLKAQGIKFHLNSKALEYQDNIVRIENNKGVMEIECDQVLVSVGRRPNLEIEGLKEIGIDFDRKGINVDNNFKTNIDNIYAIGDVNGKNMLAHYATFSGYRVLNHILGLDDKINFDLTPACVFTFPEVAAIGLTEEYCISKNLKIEVKKGLYRANGKAQAANAVDGFVKVISSEDKIFGVHIIGLSASVLIHEMSVLMNSGMKMSEFKDIIHAHPTLSEIFIDVIN